MGTRSQPSNRTLHAKGELSKDGAVFPRGEWLPLTADVRSLGRQATFAERHLGGGALLSTGDQVLGAKRKAPG